jgi:hypothetical protein
MENFLYTSAISSTKHEPILLSKCCHPTPTLIAVRIKMEGQQTDSIANRRKWMPLLCMLYQLKHRKRAIFTPVRENTFNQSKKE